MNSAREPTLLVAQWRGAEADASAWFWDCGYKLHDLKMADAERQARRLRLLLPWTWPAPTSCLRRLLRPAKHWLPSGRRSSPSCVSNASRRQPNDLRELASRPRERAGVQGCELRRYQLNAIGKIEDAIARGVRRIMLMLPTGGGKTLIASTMTAGRRRVLFVVPRLELVTQPTRSSSKPGSTMSVLSKPTTRSPTPRGPFKSAPSKLWLGANPAGRSGFHR